MSDIDHTLPDQPPPLPGEPTPATDETPFDATAEQSGDAMPTARRFYALVALAYAARLHATEERLAVVEAQARVAVETQQQQAQQLHAIEVQARAASDGVQLLSAALAGVRARLARLEERQDTRAGVDARRLTAALDTFQDAQEDRTGREDTQERRRTERRSFNAMWSARERRRAARRQQDRERFEEAVMAQYIPPAHALVPPATDQEGRTDATPASPSLGPDTVEENGDS